MTTRDYVSYSTDQLHSDLRFYRELMDIHVRAKKGICEAAEKIFSECYSPSTTRWQQIIDGCNAELDRRANSTPDSITS